ncbi:MAG: exonuclease subunit SbcD [Clostridiales bacterium]|nr:exonuclease subunit SbcD [Clostridiales bacterium]MBQ2769568.1 exonuclease subunit SbcD [Clostridia bacterium]
MKILHTSDWHIGKRLFSRERLDEQAEVLDEIAAICEEEKVELVLIAGDIFDTYTPGAEAEELFFKKVKNLAGKDRAVLIISGNHDDGVRLSAAAPLAEEQGIFIVGNSRKEFSLQTAARKTRPIVSGKGYAVFENESGDRVFVSTLPYPNEARFKEEKSELSYVEQMQKWIAQGTDENAEGLPSVFMAHLFVAGGAVSEGEREIDLGGARAIPIEALPNCDYIALGHLHKKQHMGKGHCYYSGSPLQYAFDEVPDKSVKVFDLTIEGVSRLKDVPLTKGKKLIRLEADGVEAALALLRQYPANHVELRLFLTEPLSSQDAAALAANENLVSLLAEVRTDETLQFQSRKGLSDEELFDAFYKASYGAEPKADIKRLYLETLASLSEKE